MDFRSLDREDSEFNGGWRYGVACGAAIVLLGAVMSILLLLWGIVR